MTPKSKNADAQPTISLWLDENNLYLSRRENGLSSLPTIETLRWNDNQLTLHNPEARDALATALNEIGKRLNVHRIPVRLCLGDGMCVTRVITGEPTRVQKELESVHDRSQLYLSLGFGEKLTGQVRISDDDGQEYALTSIVNLQTIQTIYDACRDASIKLASIEPVTLSVTRAVGKLKADYALPLLHIFIDQNRCDLAITLQGRLMLSYRVGGWKTIPDAATLVADLMTRLRRFCERYRVVENAKLETILLFGSDEHVSVFKESLSSYDATLQVVENANHWLSESDDVTDLVSTDEIPAIVRIALHGADSQAPEDSSILPVPDLLAGLLEQQPNSLFNQVVYNFWPSVIAACLMVAITMASWLQSSRLQVTTNILNDLTLRVNQAEIELSEWERQKNWLDRLDAVDQTIYRNDWQQLISSCAKCLPSNSRLESIALFEGRRIVLKGTMAEEDRTYEFISTLATLPMIQKVSVESVSSLSSRSAGRLQFDIRCELKSAESVAEGRLVTTSKSSASIQ